MKKACLFTILLLLFLVACQSEQEKLQKRVEEYWQLRLKRDLAQAYNYEYPVLRKKINLKTYIASRSNPLARYLKAGVLDIKFPQKDLAEVRMKFEIEVKPLDALNSFKTKFERTEKWVKIKGEWYHVPAK